MNLREARVPQNLLELATNAQKSRETKINELLTKRKWPEEGWSKDLIKSFLWQMSNLDSNNFEKHSSLGEREGHIISELVRERHYGLAHGVGRSGNLSEIQPKAVGSTIMAQITESLVLDWLHLQGLQCCRRAAIIPLATGMTLTLCFLTLKKQRPSAKYILWSRIDQVSCFKSMTTAGFRPIVIDTIPIKEDEQEKGSGLITDLSALEKVLEEYKLKLDEILCIMSTSSCFAPRSCDDLQAIASLAKRYDIPHVINNAYGVQSTYLTHQIQQAHRTGRVDLFVQSTDKNLLVPVGGAIVASAAPHLIQQVLQTYAGRGTITPTLDVLITFLELGRRGYRDLVRKRKELFQHLYQRLEEFVRCEDRGSVIRLKANPISIAVDFAIFSTGDPTKATELGARLFTRGVTGARVVVPGVEKRIDDYIFHNWGCHTNHDSLRFPYLTVAASIGIQEQDVDRFIKKLGDCLPHLKVN